MKHAPLYALLVGTLLLAGCPAPKASDSSAPSTPPPPTASADDPAAPEPAKTNAVATLPEVTYYALSG